MEKISFNIPHIVINSPLPDDLPDGALVRIGDRLFLAVSSGQVASPEPPPVEEPVLFALALDGIGSQIVFDRIPTLYDANCWTIDAVVQFTENADTGYIVGNFGIFLVVSG